MSFLSLIAWFGSVTISMAGACLWAKFRPPLWLFIFIIPALLGGYLFLVHFLPFHGVLTELPLLLLVIAVTSVPIALFWRIILSSEVANSPQFFAARRRAPLMFLGVGILWVGSCAATMLTIDARINYTRRIAWSCDGKILEVTHGKRHPSHLMLVVQDSGGTVSFEPVEGSLWERAKPGQHLTKVAGSPMGLLDGERARMVSRQMGWMHEPP